MNKYFLTLSAIFLLLLLTLNIYFNPYNKLLSAKCPKEGSVASIVWKRTLPFYLVDAYLIIEKNNGDLIYKQLLLKGRDDYGDIKNEFLNISWDCDKVSLELKRNYYKGPSIITPEP